MNIVKIISAAIAGTTAMTLFSYAVSEEKNKNFKEPENLGKLIHRLWPQTKTSTSQIEGWLLHYLAGVIFAMTYDRIWKKNNTEPTLSSGLVLGGISGLIGMGVWKATLDLHPNPPHTDQKKYLMHLLAAHLVFGAFTELGYKLGR